MGEQHPPGALVEHAVAAEAAGFDVAVFSDHFHPWLEEQGESPFTWTVLGAVAARTERLRLMTMVTWPHRPLPPGDRGPGRGDGAAPVGRALHARPRRGRAAQRARHGCALAGGARAP